MKFKKNFKKGFTLVELIVVIAIVAILAAVSVVSYIAFINSANESADIQLVKQLNTCLQADEALHGKKDWSENYQGLRDLLEGNGFIVENLTKTKSGCDMVYQGKTDDETIINRYALLKGDDIIYSESTFASGNNHRNLWIPETVKEAQDLSREGKGVVLGSEIGEVTLFEAHASVIVDGAKVDKIQYSNDVSQKVVIRTNGGELTVNDKGTNGSVTHYGVLDKALVKTDMNCFVTHGTISYMKLTDGKAIADENGIIYLMEAETETAAAEERGGVIIIPASATTAEIQTPADNLPEGYVVTETGTTQPANIAAKIAANQGLLGSGTENDPFQIYNYQTFQAVSYFFDSGYHYFKVNKELTIKKNNNEFRIDCTGWVPVYLHGSFDGSGVKFTNVTACLFQTVGYKLQNENVLLKDFDATMNVSSNAQYGAAALIKNIFNAGTTTFSNVNVHGYLEGFWNMGSFYNYGTANYDDVGCDYEVVFNDCYSDATLVCASGNTIGGLFGHAYEGNGNSFTLRVNNTKYAGQMFLTTASGKGNKYFGMTSDYYNSHNHFYFDGVEDTFDNGNSKNAGAYTNSRKITEVKATKGSNGYVVEKQANVSKIVATITAQLTAYDANGVKISNLSGITMTLSSTELTELGGSNIKVLDLFNSIDITKNASEYAAVVSNNTLNIRLSSSANYQSGNIRLQVNQYDSTGSIVSAGTIDLVTSADANSEWIVK